MAAMPGYERAALLRRAADIVTARAERHRPRHGAGVRQGAA